MDSLLVSLAGTARDGAVFAMATFGVGAACAPRAGADPLRRLLVGVAMGFLGAYAIGFLGFAVGWSNSATAAWLAAIAAATIGFRWQNVRTLAADREVRRCFAGWLVFAVWALALLALVRSYSGGGWAADWVEHWQRTGFFVERQPLGTRFAAIYPLPARPPLANLLIALWLESGPVTFARFQVFMTLFGTLIFVPAWVLAHRWSRTPNCGWWVLATFMANPLVAENLTFAWTKLPTAFFVLAGACFAVRALDATETVRRDAVVSAACLGLATLTHYSAIPWAMALSVAFVVTSRRHVRSPRWREMILSAAVYAVIVGPWIGWTIGHYGWAEATGGNTTASAWHEQTPVQRLLVPIENIFDTLVPFPLRGEPAGGLIQQSSRLGRVRDVAFNLYQINLPFAFGLAGLWVLARRALEPTGASSRNTAARERSFFWIAIPAIIVVGIVVHTPRDTWGLAHICLQPLVLLGLVWIAATLSSGPRRLVTIWATLAAIDVALGIALPFGLESHALARFIGRTPEAFLGALSRSALANANDKAAFHLTFFGDLWRGATPAVVAVLAAAAFVVVRRLRQDAHRHPRNRADPAAP